MALSVSLLDLEIGHNEADFATKGHDVLLFVASQLDIIQVDGAQHLSSLTGDLISQRDHRDINSAFRGTISEPAPFSICCEIGAEYGIPHVFRGG